MEEKLRARFHWQAPPVPSAHLQGRAYHLYLPHVDPTVQAVNGRLRGTQSDHSRDVPTPGILAANLRLFSSPGKGRWSVLFHPGSPP